MLHTEKAPCDGVAALTFELVRFEAVVLPHSSKSRKYALTVDGGAHESSLPAQQAVSVRSISVVVMRYVPLTSVEGTVARDRENQTTVHLISDRRDLRKPEAADVDIRAVTVLQILFVESPRIVVATAE